MIFWGTFIWLAHQQAFFTSVDDLLVITKVINDLVDGTMMFGLLMIYRSATEIVERLVMKGMPLGVFSDLPYQTREATLGVGDVVLLMSDGFLEMFNASDETFDEARVVEAFREAAGQGPKDIIGHLLDKGREWAGGHSQRDDVTFVVMKMV
jgi:serine phosphatase RsbU (regulator of sigma subunit)